MFQTIELPEELHAAIAQVLAATPPARWIQAAQELSERYRGARDPQAAPLAAKPLEMLGYAAMILPATYAQLWGAMAATAMRVPGWAPRTMLDIGSGPGTAFWAAMAHWPSLQSLAAWERERAFIELGRRLAQASPDAALRTARWVQMDLRRAHTGSGEQYDLVVLGHVLNELPVDDQLRVVDMAWKLTAGVLLIVEPGTSAAFPVVRMCRDHLLSTGAHTLAPCPHDRPCPLVDDWCHFPQRIMRPPFQRRARAAPSQWEDSKYSYAAMARFPAAPIWGRVIREPTANKAYAETKISSPAGTSRYRAWKRYRDAYRSVRDLRWGQVLPEPLPDPIEALDIEGPEE